MEDDGARPADSYAEEARDESRPLEERIASGLVAVKMLSLTGDRLSLAEMMFSQVPLQVRESAQHELFGEALADAALMAIEEALHGQAAEGENPGRYLVFPPDYELERDGISLSAKGVLDSAALMIYREGYIATLEIELLFTKAYNAQRPIDERARAAKDACLACALLDLGLPLEIMLSEPSLPGVLRGIAEKVLDQLPTASLWVDSETPEEEFVQLDFLPPEVQGIVGKVFDAVKARGGGLPALRKDVAGGDVDIELIYSKVEEDAGACRKAQELQELSRAESAFEKGDCRYLRDIIKWSSHEPSRREARELVRRMERQGRATRVAPEKKMRRR